jgi:hypothetical protein
LIYFPDGSFLKALQPPLTRSAKISELEIHFMAELGLAHQMSYRENMDNDGITRTTRTTFGSKGPRNDFAFYKMLKNSNRIWPKGLPIREVRDFAHLKEWFNGCKFCIVLDVHGKKGPPEKDVKRAKKFAERFIAEQGRLRELFPIAKINGRGAAAAMTQPAAQVAEASEGTQARGDIGRRCEKCWGCGLKFATEKELRRHQRECEEYGKRFGIFLEAYDDDDTLFNSTSASDDDEDSSDDSASSDEEANVAAVGRRSRAENSEGFSGDASDAVDEGQSDGDVEYIGQSDRRTRSQPADAASPNPASATRPRPRRRPIPPPIDDQACHRSAKREGLLKRLGTSLRSFEGDWDNLEVYVNDYIENPRVFVPYVREPSPTLTELSAWARERNTEAQSDMSTAAQDPTYSAPTPPPRGEGDLTPGEQGAAPSPSEVESGSLLVDPAIEVEKEGVRPEETGRSDTIDEERVVEVLQQCNRATTCKSIWHRRILAICVVTLLIALRRTRAAARAESQQVT